MDTLSNEVRPADHVQGPAQGHWTYSHYAALSDDGNTYEILNGVLYMTPPSPNGFHQEAVSLIASYLITYVKHTGRGRVFVAPFDVQLANDMLVQPDICVLLNEHNERFTPSRIIGAPDLVVEIASPGTACYDRTLKKDAYAYSGVPEYWLVDRLQQTVEVLVLEDSVYTSIGIFHGEKTLSSRIVLHFPVRVEQFFE